MDVRITEVTVSAGTTFNHPFEGYCNFRPGVTLKANVEGNADEVLGVTLALQGQAQKLVDDERKRIEEKIRKEREIEDLRYRLSRDWGYVRQRKCDLAREEAKAQPDFVEVIRQELGRGEAVLLKTKAEFKALTGEDWVEPVTNEDEEDEEIPL